jgi:hypothetical protein
MTDLRPTKEKHSVQWEGIVQSLAATWICVISTFLVLFVGGCSAYYAVDLEPVDRVKPDTTSEVSVHYLDVSSTCHTHTRMVVSESELKFNNNSKKEVRVDISKFRLESSIYSSVDSLSYNPYSTHRLYGSGGISYIGYNDYSDYKNSSNVGDSVKIKDNYGYGYFLSVPPDSSVRIIHTTRLSYNADLGREECASRLRLREDTLTIATPPVFRDSQIVVPSRRIPATYVPKK